MIAYGEDFPEFLAGRDGAAASLADVARLENAWVEAYHAADEDAATVADLAELSPDSLPEARIAFHPAARFLRFSTPAASIWAAPQGGAGPAEPVAGSPKTRSSPVPTPTSGCASCRRSLMISP